MSATAGDFTVTIADAGMTPSTYFRAGEFIFDGQQATAGWSEREKARPGTFILLGSSTASSVRHYNLNANSGNFLTIGGYTQQEGHELWSVEAGEFLVQIPCNKYTSVKAEAGEFLLEGVRAVFNSETTHLDAGPNAHFRIELQEVKAYGNFTTNTHTTFKVEGSDIQVGCGQVSYTRWDAGASRWDIGATLWDKVKGPDIPCPIEPNTLQAGEFLLTSAVGVSGYLEIDNNRVELNRLYTEPGEFHVVHPDNSSGNVTLWVEDAGATVTTWPEVDLGVDTEWYDTCAGINLFAGTGEFRIELQRISQYTTVDLSLIEQTEWIEDVMDVHTLWDKRFRNPVEEEECLWDVDFQSNSFEVNMIEVGATVTRADGSIEHPDGIKDPSRRGMFNLSGGDVWFDYQVAPPPRNNVIMLAEYREFKLSDSCNKQETFWDQYDHTTWYDEGYGEALWTEHYQDTRLVQWDADEARTLWDKDKSRWDRNKECTSLDIDYVMKSNCK